MGTIDFDGEEVDELIIDIADPEDEENYYAVEVLVTGEYNFRF